MGRRVKKRAAGDFIDIVALMPWWAGVGLGVLSYFLPHGYANSPVPAAAAGQVSGAIQHALLKGLASAGQYLLPLLCFIGAGLSALRRHKRASLADQVATAPAAGALDGMTWREFEMLVGEAFRRKGYAVAEIGGGGPDGGVDIILAKGGERFFVQCKQWKAFKVGVEVVRELYGVMAARGAAGGFVVTSGGFTPDAKAFAEGRNVTLLDGPQLVAMIQMARNAPASGPAQSPQRIEPVLAAPPAQGQQPPSCPKCGAGMVLRAARKGANAGASFWGCSRFPNCRGVLAAKETP
jgi:restriction system protein